MKAAAYLLCAATCVACSVLLLRGFRNSGAQLLLWSGLCFLALAAENVFLFVDVIVLPQVDLSLYRSLPALVGLSLLLYGMIWNVK